MLGNLTGADQSELSVGDATDDDPTGYSSQEVREVLETALFAAFGPERLVWAHATYSEWLAARFLLDAQLSPIQLRSLLVEPSTKKIYPQLHEVAAWTANGDAELMDWLIENDPAVLLRSELANLDDAQKAKLITSLVGEMRRGSLEEPWGARHIYAKLAYPSAEDDLRPIIADVQEDQYVRRLAINLAEGMRLQGVVDDVLAVTLSPSEPIRLRIQSLWYVKDIGAPKTRRGLRPLIYLRGKENRGLKEEALLALWPEFLSTRRMLRLYSRGHDRTERHGSWHASYQIAELLTDDDLEIGLRQMLARRLRRGENHELGRVGKTLCERAWKNIHQACIARLLSQIVARRLRLHRPAFDWDTLDGFTQQAFRADSERRRILIESVVQTSRSSVNESFDISPLLDKSDFRWLLTKAVVDNDPIWAWAARSQTDLSSSEDLALAFEAAQASSSVCEAFYLLFQSPIGLRNNRWRRENREWELKAKSERMKRDARITQLRSALRNLFDESSTNPDAFWRVVAHLSLNSEEHFEFSGDVRALPGWQCLDDEQRAKWLGLCEHYLGNADPKPGKRALFSATWPDCAGYLAFISLSREMPDFIDSPFGRLRLSVWTAAVLRVANVVSDAETTGQRDKLLHAAYSQNPESFLEELDVLLEWESGRLSGHSRALERIANIWDEHISELALRRLVAVGLEHAYAGHLLEQLALRGYDPAILYAKDRLRSGNLDEECRIPIMSILFRLAPGASWDILKPAFLEDIQMLKAVVEGFHLMEWKGLATLLMGSIGRDEVATLYEALVAAYPPSPNGESDRDLFGVGRFRDSLPAALADEATPEAVSLLQRLEGRLSHVYFLKHYVADAQEKLRKRLWDEQESIRPSELLALVQRSDRRFVLDGEHLMEVVLETLEKFNESLQAKGRSEVLWGDDRPKREDELNDEVEHELSWRLEDRRVIVNREVRLKRGSRTDLYVQAVARRGTNSESVISLVIESKGCWNPHLDSAMENQLVKQYLSPNNGRHGIYVVGQYECEAWSEQDYRLANARANRNKGIDFDAQAQSLSVDGLTLRYFELNCRLPSEKRRG